jgi:hypothetical protein
MTVNGAAYTGLHVRDPNLKNANSINGEELKLLRAADGWQLIGKDGKVQEKFDLDTFSRGANGELELNKDNASKAELKKLKAFKSFKELTGREYGNIVARNTLSKETAQTQDTFSSSQQTLRPFSVSTAPEQIKFTTATNLSLNLLDLPNNPPNSITQPLGQPSFTNGSLQVWRDSGAQNLENIRSQLPETEN